MLAYRIPKFHEAHCRNELDKLSKKGKPWPWVRVPTSMSSDGMRMLIATPGGVAAFGIYILLVEIAANTPVRGVLANENGAMDARRLAVRTGAPADVIDRAIAILADPTIGWIDQVEIVIEGEEISISDPLTPERTTARKSHHEPRPTADGLVNRMQADHGRSDLDFRPTVDGLPNDRDDIRPNADGLESDLNRLHPESDRPQTVLDEDEDEEVEEEIDEEGEQPACQTEGSSGCQPRTRSGGLQLWVVQCLRLSAPEGSSQRRSDKTSAQRLYDELVWPEELDAVVGNDRLRRSMAIAGRAGSIKPRPMAWLTKTLKVELADVDQGVSGE